MRLPSPGEVRAAHKIGPDFAHRLLAPIFSAYIRAVDQDFATFFPGADPGDVLATFHQAAEGWLHEMREGLHEMSDDDYRFYSDVLEDHSAVLEFTLSQEWAGEAMRYFIDKVKPFLAAYGDVWATHTRALKTCDLSGLHRTLQTEDRSPTIDGRRAVREALCGRAARLDRVDSGRGRRRRSCDRPRRRAAARRAAGLRSGQDPGSEDPEPEPATTAALSHRAYAFAGGHNRTGRGL